MKHHKLDIIYCNKLKSQGYEAFFFAIGAHKAYQLGVPGEADFPQTMEAIDLLRRRPPRAFVQWLTGSLYEALGATAGEFNGQLIWSTAIDVLDGERQWNHALLIAFPNGSALSAWLTAPATSTDRALVRRQHASEAMLELQSG